MTALTLRPYQEDALDRVIEARGRGVMRQLGVAATGLGKAQPVDEPVLTPDGWRPIGDLVPGDEVIGSCGTATTVRGVFPQGERPVLRVEFSDGAWTRCDAEHLWAVRDKQDAYRHRPWRVVTATELSPRWRIPLPAPVEGHDAPLPLDPYLLGVLLGDGGLSVPGRVLVHTEMELAATLEVPAPCTVKLLTPIGQGVAGTFIIGGPPGRGRNPVLSAIRQLGLEGSRSTDKRIPWVYVHANPAARLALLRGIMDADGHARPDGHVELTLANEDLIDDVAALVRSLGGTAKKAAKMTTWRHRGALRHGDAWRLSIAMTECPFRWKTPRWRPRTKYQPMRQVRSVTEDGTAECVCIAVEAADQLYVTRDYIVTHNTVMFCALAERLGCRTLILAHRDELITQAVAKVREVWPGVDVGVVKAGQNDVRHHVVVASVQTLGRKKRLDQLLAPIDGTTGSIFDGRSEAFGLVIVDEAHHTAADSYRRILDGVAAWDPLVLGVTATPDRGDGKGLADLFDEITFSLDILWGIRAGYLSDLRGVRVVLDEFDVGDLRKKAGDYDQGQAGSLMEKAGAPDLIVRAWLREAQGRKTLVFTPTVALAESIAAQFEAAGIAAGSVSGETPIDERRALLGRFSSGETTVLTNCAVLTEGYDEPSVDCVVIARPTQSRALYTQMVGRGTRRHPDKTDCLVLDVVGASADHSLVTVPSLFGIEKGYARGLGDGSASVSDTIERQQREAVAAGRLRAEEVDLFEKVRAEGVAWVPIHKDGQRRRYERSLGKGRPTVVLVQDRHNPEAWIAGLLNVDGQPDTKQVLIHGVSLETAQGVAEDAVRKLGGGALTDVSAPWRARRPSKKQLGLAKRWHMTVDPAWNAGELSDAIDAHIARVKAKKKPARQAG